MSLSLRSGRTQHNFRIQDSTPYHFISNNIKLSIRPLPVSRTQYRVFHSTLAQLVARKVDNAIHRIDRSPVDNTAKKQTCSPLASFTFRNTRARSWNTIPLRSQKKIHEWHPLFTDKEYQEACKNIAQTWLGGELWICDVIMYFCSRSHGYEITRQKGN